MLKNIKISARIYGTFILVILMVFLFFAYRNQQGVAVRNQYQTVISQYDVVSINLARLNTTYAQSQNKLASLLLTESVTEEEAAQNETEIEETSAQLEKYIGIIQDAISDADLKSDFEEITENLDLGKDAAGNVVALLQSNKRSEALEAYNSEYQQVISQTNDQIEEMLEKCTGLSETEAEDAFASQSANDIRSTIFLVVLAVLIIAFCIVTVRSIVKPMYSLVDTVKKLSKGDINVKAEKVNNDEIGVLTDAVNALAAKNMRAARIAEQVSDGDLSMLVNPESEEDVLGNSIKLLVDENNITMTNIREAAAQVKSGSAQIAIASQSLAQGSTQQASSLEQLTASLDDITKQTKANAEFAKEADNLVRETKDNAAAGSQEMDNMVAAMGEINESSENIFKIIKTIDDIAFQTNILALNAAVEAARAGEHGKGFAVVAEEVRSLAEKSAAAASETAEMIEDSIQKVQNGSELAERTQNKLSEIVSAVEKTAKLLDDIAEASANQANGLSQVDIAVEQVSQVVQTNSATSQQCAAASEQLSGQAKGLEELVQKYRLRGFSGAETAKGAIAASGIHTTQSMDSSRQQDSFGYRAGSTDTANTGYTIPDASDFVSVTNSEANEQIISLEDNSYSKY
ncbi:MAG: methyl-accepting chemotaxis protein [Clostridiaceae bacterium]|nr:methyl-accepting chemotaxis protein [Clostridiaceae bacterium]